jgi:thiosulfate dehydrogenase [quinone] large subunit
MVNMSDQPTTEKPTLSLGLKGLLIIQIAVGYEWLMSGLTKIIRGGFPAGLAAELHDNAAAAAPWYRWFLVHVVIANGSAFGYLIEIVEVLAGAALITTALLWLLRWQRLASWARTVTLGTIVAAALAAIFMAVNFHLANGSTHPWILPREGFDESVDLDSLLPLIQGVFIWVSVATWLALRRARQVATPEIVAPAEPRDATRIAA